MLVTGQAETPGYGAEMIKEENPLLASFKGKKAGELNMALKADGGDIEAISGATISSEAYIKAVSAAYQAFQQVK